MRTLHISHATYRHLLMCISLGLIWSSLAFAQSEPKAKAKRIAILELANRTRQQVSPEEIHYLTNEMRRIVGFLPTDQFLVMTKESIEVLIDPDQSLEDCDGSCEVETGRLLGADWILTGEVIRFGKSLRVSVKLHETRSGQYLAGESLKGKEVEDLELPIQLSTLKLVYQISPTFERQIIAKAGPKVAKQLECIKDRSACRAAHSQSVAVRSATPRARQNRQPAQPDPKPKSASTSIPRARQSGYMSQSDLGVTVDAFGLLLFGPTIALEMGEQASLRLLYRGLSVGALSHVALAPEDGDSLDSGLSFGVGYRKYNDRERARRGLYWGVDLEYMVIETSYSEFDSSFSTTSDVLTSILHFGYRWVSDDMLIGDLFGVGLWLAYALPLDSSQTFSDNYEWPESYTEIDNESRVYGGISMELGWMF